MIYDLIQLIHCLFLDPCRHDPTVDDFWRVDVKMGEEDGGGRCKIEIYDTAGQDEFRNYRDMYYRTTGLVAFVFVFSVTSKASVEYAENLHTEMLKQKVEPLCAALRTDFFSRENWN